MKIFFNMMCVMHYSLISQAFSHSIIMWISYPWLNVWLDLIYTSYCFTLLHCNVVPLSFAFDTFFCGWSWTWKLCESNNFHCHNWFGINFIHTFNQLKVSSILFFLVSIIIQKFIHAPHSSKYFIFLVTFIHVDVVFIRHNYFGISSIYTFELVKNFIQFIHQLVIIIQKIHWCSTFIQYFHPFKKFIHVHVEKYFSMSFLCGIGIF